MNIEVICPYCNKNNTNLPADEFYWTKDIRTMYECEYCSKNFEIIGLFKSEPLDIKDKTKIFYEWMYKVDNEQHWHICSRLMTEEQGIRWFTAENIMKNKESKIKYKKTGRKFMDIEHD